jgi:anti-sigma regulatory factor (Ser/Thr protein kinase)
MVPMSGGAVTALPEGLLDGGTWYRVEAASTARRPADRLAAELGLPERRRADLAIVVAEAAGNLVKHAEQGVLLLRAVRAGCADGVLAARLP